MWLNTCQLGLGINSRFSCDIHYYRKALYMRTKRIRRRRHRIGVGQRRPRRPSHPRRRGVEEGGCAAPSRKGGRRHRCRARSAPAVQTRRPPPSSSSSPCPLPSRKRAPRMEVGEGRRRYCKARRALPRRMGGRGREAAAACAEPAACPSSRPAAHRCRCRIAHRRRGREVAAAHGRSVKGGHRCCRARHCRTGWEVGEGRPLPPVPSPPLTRRSRSPYRAAAAPPHPCLAVGKRERGEKERVRG